MPSRAFLATLADHRAFSANFRLSTAPAATTTLSAPKATAATTLSPPKATATAPAPVPRPSAPPPPLSPPLPAPPPLLPYFAHNALKPDIAHPNTFPIPRSGNGLAPAEAVWEGGVPAGGGGPMPAPRSSFTYAHAPVVREPEPVYDTSTSSTSLRQQEWENVYGPGAPMPSFTLLPPSPPSFPRAHPRVSYPTMPPPPPPPATITSRQQREWENVYGPGAPMPTFFCPEEAFPIRSSGAPVPNKVRFQHGAAAGVSPLWDGASAEVEAGAGGEWVCGAGEEVREEEEEEEEEAGEEEEEVGEEEEEATRRSQGGHICGHGFDLAGSGFATGDSVPDPSPALSISNATGHADASARVEAPVVARPGTRERAARLQRQRGEERREAVRSLVGGLRIPGHDYGDGEGAEETARARRAGVWVGPSVGPSVDLGVDGDKGVGEAVRLRGGGCAISRWHGGGAGDRRVAVDERGGQECGEGGLEGVGGGEGSRAEDERVGEEDDIDEEAGDEEGDEVEWSEVEGDDQHLSSSLSPQPAWGADSDANEDSDWDDEEEPFPFKNEMVWDEELGRRIILVSSSFTTRDERALVEVAEIHLDGEEEVRA